MNIVGVDQSISCTGVTHLQVNEDLDIIDRQHYFTSSVIKRSKKICSDITPWFVGRNIFGFDKIIKICYFIDKFFEDIGMKEGDILAIEGYSYDSESSNLVQLGEIAGIIKYIAKLYGASIRTYQPTNIKQFATMKGAGKKAPMFLAYHKLYPKSNILKHYDTIDHRMPIEIQLSRVGGKPLCDLIDSSFISEMALGEHMMRVERVKGLSISQMECYTNRPKVKKGKKPKLSILETAYN